MLREKLVSISQKSESLKVVINLQKNSSFSDPIHEINKSKNQTRIETRKDGYVKVINGAKQKPVTDFKIKTSNPFALLEIEECETETVLI